MTPLSRENISPRVITIISDCLGIKRSELKETDSICDLGDSLDHIEIWMACEDEFGVDIGDEDAKEVETIRELIDLIMSRPPVAGTVEV